MVGRFVVFELAMVGFVDGDGGIYGFYATVVEDDCGEAKRFA